MPPGMLQQMQRQLRGGGGMQEMMKAMMQGQGGDQMDMEEMQSKQIIYFFINLLNAKSKRNDVANGGRIRRTRRIGWTRRIRWRNGRYVEDDGNGRRSLDTMYYYYYYYLFLQILLLGRRSRLVTENESRSVFVCASCFRYGRGVGESDLP